MEGIVTCIATKLAECLWDPISRHARYLFCFNKYIGDVEKAKRELEVKLADVNMRKEKAARRTEEIMPSVKKWLEEVIAILEEVQKLQQELEGGGNKCFNVSLRYSLAKQMEDKANKMKELKNFSFETFSQLIQLPGINTHFSSKEVKDFKSRKSTYNSILEAIKDGKNKMVGLYGMGGSGKTTLAIEVGKKVEQLKLFDKVVMVVVSRPLNVRNIQGEIKEKTGLEFEEPTTDSTRAERLLIGLRSMKVLIILDDVWSDLNLQEIGILPNENCRILLTTRLREVCDSMQCERTFELSLLTREEAQTLLMMHANLTNDSFNELDDVGRKIVDECKGLPIALVTVGSALRGKGIEAWKSTLRKLQHSIPLDVDESSRGPYACLKLSYDYLPSLAKQLFLLCSMFPEDHEIHKEDLIRFAKGTLEFDEIAYTMEDARNEILVSIHKLLDSCLLMHTDKQACVKMHDLVRDVALWITKKEHQAILVDRHVISKMLDENETLKEAKAISLWNLEYNFKLSNQLCCPTLEILLLHSVEGLIEDLGGNESLKVLILVKFSFGWKYYYYEEPIQWSMPQSIVPSLMNLHTLCFRGIVLGDISFLCHVKRLEILDLHGSQFDELPGGIVDMKKLKLLDVFGCEIEKSPLEVIQRCEQLEELYISENKSDILENFSLSGLKRYVIYYMTFGCDILDFDSCDEPLRALSIQDFEGSDLNSSIIFSLSMSQLYIVECPNLTTIFTHATIISLPKLRTLHIYGCDKVKWLFSYSLAIQRPLLEELKITWCDELERLIQEEVAHEDRLLHQRESHHDLPNYPYGNETDKRDCSQHESLDEEASHEYILLLLLKLKTLTLWDLPKLREIFGGRFKHKLESLHNKQEYSSHKHKNERVKVVNLELISIHLRDMPEWKYIWKGPTQFVSLYRLEEVRLWHCSRLKHIFTLAIVTSLPELREIYVRVCEEWEGIFCEESLKNISSSIVCLPRLKRIIIYNCHKVRRLFSYALASHCPSLEEITILDCSQLEGVVQAYEGEVAGRHEKLFPKLNKLELNYLPELREIYHEFNHLSGTIDITGCPNICNIPL